MTVWCHLMLTFACSPLLLPESSVHPFQPRVSVAQGWPHHLDLPARPASQLCSGVSKDSFSILCLVPVVKPSRDELSAHLDN